MVKIPATSDEVLYQQITTLEGTDYLLTFALNLRDSYWYLDIADQDGVPIVSNIKIVVAWDLLKRCTDIRRPPGVLLAVDLTGSGLDPGPTDLGGRVELRYLTAAEVGR